MKKKIAGALALVLLLIPATALATETSVPKETYASSTEISAPQLNEMLQKERNAQAMYEKMVENFGENTPYDGLRRMKERHAQRLEAHMENSGIAVTAGPGQATVPSDEIEAVQAAVAAEKEIEESFRPLCSWDLSQNEDPGRCGIGLRSGRQTRLLEDLLAHLRDGRSSADFRFGTGTFPDRPQRQRGCRGWNEDFHDRFSSDREYGRGHRGFGWKNLPNETESDN